jgi:predicted extracellular nuclease
VASEDQASCPFNQTTHFCAGGLHNTRNYTYGFYIYYGQGAVYDRYWSEYSAFVVSNGNVYFRSTDGAIIALTSGSPTAGLGQGADGTRAEKRIAEPRAVAARNVDVGLAVIAQEHARAYAGQVRSVEGVVRFVHNNGRKTGIAFQVPHQGGFKGLILRDSYAAFGGRPEDAVRVGQRVRITGKIDWYQGDPTIYVVEPSQIEVIEDLEAARPARARAPVRGM